MKQGEVKLTKVYGWRALHCAAFALGVAILAVVGLPMLIVRALSKLEDWAERKEAAGLAALSKEGRDP